MPEWIVRLLEQWAVVTAAPVPFTVAVVIVGAIIWFALSWSYRSIISRRDAEIKLLERQVEDLQERRTNTPQNALVERAELRLLIHGDDRTPTRITGENIWRWYWLRAIYNARQADGTDHRAHVAPILFVNFDSPVFVGALEIDSDGFRLPLHEVKAFTNRYAIVVFLQDLPAGTLIIRVHR
jgi:hypothetical protein